jgi:transposase-like protein
LKSKSKLRCFTAEFKAQVVRRMRAGESVAKLSREVKVKRSVLYRWRDAYRKEGMEGLRRPRGRPRGRARDPVPVPASEARLRELERKVGQQAMVIDFLQRAFKRVKALRQPSKGPGGTASMERSKP